MMTNSEDAQQSLKSQYWLSWKPETIANPIPSVDGRTIHEVRNMDTTVFHAEFGKDGSTVQIVIPGTSLRFTTNIRFRELCMEPTKLPCPLQKVYPILSEVNNASRFRLNPNWSRRLLCTTRTVKDHVLSQAYTQFNTHIADLIEPLMATLDATSLKNLAENREVLFVSVETMTGTFKKRARVKWNTKSFSLRT